MYIVRSVKLDDLDSFEECAAVAGIGISNLPRKREFIKKQIRSSVRATSKEVTTPKDEDYIFVLSDSKDNIIKGTSGIYSSIKGKHPLFTFQIEALNDFPEYLPRAPENRVLVPKRFKGNPSEICALYLLPELRKGGYGKLLSLSRFLVIASSPHRFSNTFVANMRGFIENDISPVWEGLGRHFLPLPFAEVVAMRSIDEYFLGKIFPKFPIPVALLPQNARNAIGTVHANTVPALQMLIKEGFKLTSHIDRTDGGPILEAETQEIHSVIQSKLGRVKEITRNPIESERYILCNNNIDFRACYATLKIMNAEEVIIDADVAEALHLDVGSAVRYIMI